MKRILITACITSLLFSSCLKDTTINTISSPNSPLAEIFYDNNSNSVGGIENFSKGFVLTAGSPTPVVTEFFVDFASGNYVNKDVTIKVGVTDSLRVAYNAANGTNYEAMPDSVYSLSPTSLTIKAGQALTASPFSVSFGLNLDPTRSYCLPISIIDASGQSISDNFHTVYYYTIGNPIAGPYTWDFTRYNTQDGSGAVNGASFKGHSNTFLPDNTTTIEVTSGYYTGTARYVLSFTGTTLSNLSNFALAFNSADVKNIFTANGISVTQQPVILKADAVNKNYSFQYVVFNGTAYRYIIDSYHNP